VFRYHRGWFALRAGLAAAVLAARLAVPVMLQGFMKYLECTDCAGYDTYKAAGGGGGGGGGGAGAPKLVRPPRWQGWMWAAGLVGLSLASIVLDAVNTWNTQAHSNTMRMQLGAALSAKALRLGGAEMNAVFGAGRLLNAFSADARRVSELNMMVEFLVTAPLVTAVAFLMIGRAVGPVAAAMSTAVYICALPLVVSSSLRPWWLGWVGACSLGVVCVAAAAAACCLAGNLGTPSCISEQNRDASTTQEPVHCSTPPTSHPSPPSLSSCAPT
jgi:hypothetical protein